MQRKPQTQKTELSRLVDLHELRKNDMITLDLRATEAECAALAKRFGILDVHDLDAHITLMRGARPDLFKVEGELSAVVVQECCVTLAPVEERVAESYSELLTTSPQMLGPADDTDMDGDKPVELIQGDAIDIGEVVAQWLALTLNPYPRSDAPTFEYIEAAGSTKDMQTPFKVLETIQER
jgi:uncharacterized metal-binding protein YceD (DUF177 family)